MDTTETVAYEKNKRGQSAIEYLTTYGWAILIIGIIVSILYLYLAVPPQIVSNSCNFVNGASCQDFILGVNTTTKVTKAEFWLTNGQPDPLENPVLYLQYAGQNVSPVTCLPTNTLVLSGGLINCTVVLPINATLGALVAGNLYLNATYCGLTNQSYQSTQTCNGAAQQVYTGSFAAHVQPFIPIKAAIFLTAANYTTLANGRPDLLTATVKLSGDVLKGAPVNFSVNNSAYYLAPNLTITNVDGNALSDISSTAPGNVIVNATYAGVSNSIEIDLLAPVYVVFLSTNFPYCSSAGVIAQVDSASYTCNQLSGRTFTYAKGSTHSYSFLSPVSAGSGIQGTFTNVTVEGITYTDPQGAIVADTNLTVPFSYSSQYSFTEIANPAIGGNVLPGSGWYNTSQIIPISESATGSYTFNGWTGIGSGSYTGLNPTQTLIVANTPITETAFFTSTSTSTTTSTSTSSTSSTSSIVVGTYSIDISENPAAAANTWGACYEVEGYPQSCAGNGVSTNAVSYPANSTLDYVCTARWQSPSAYTFSSWSGSYTGLGCVSVGSLNISVTSNMSIQANYVLTTTSTTVATTSTKSVTSTVGSTSTTITEYYVQILYGLCTEYQYTGRTGECNPTVSGYNITPVGIPIAGWYPAGTVLVLNSSTGITFDGADCAYFAGWAGSGAGSYTGTTGYTAHQTTSNPENITVDGDITESASYVNDYHCR